MPYPLYMDKLGAWPSSPNPWENWQATGQATAGGAATGTQDPAPDPTGQAPTMTSSDPNAGLGNQAVADLIRRKQGVYNPATWSGVGSPLTGQPGPSPSDFAAMNRVPDGAPPGVTTPSSDISNTIAATNRVAGMGQSGQSGQSGATVIPSDQRTLIAGSPRLTNGLSPEQWQAIQKATAGDSRFDSRPSTATFNGQNFTSTPGRRIPIEAANTILARNKLDTILGIQNQQADLANQRQQKLAAVPGQNAVALQNAKSTGDLSLQKGQQDFASPMMKQQVNNMVQSGRVTQAEADNMVQNLRQDTPESRLGKSYLTLAGTLAEDNPLKARLMMHGLQAANPGVSIPQDILQGFGTSGAQTQSQVDANTEDYITTPDFQSQVAAVRQAKPGLASRTLESVGAGNIAPTNSNKYLDASDSVKRHFLDIAARKHLNPDRLTAEAMRQGNQ